MTIFDQIKAIAFTKQHVDVMQTDQPVSPYMIQRWLSMYSPQVAMLVNATTNQTWNAIVADPQMFVNLFETIVPRLPFARISYIKKPQIEQPKDNKTDVIEMIAHLFQISQREALQYIEQDPTLAPKFADSLEVFRKTRLKSSPIND